MIDPEKLKERQKQWDAYHAWEEQNEVFLGGARALHLIGECLDFYRSRHRLDPRPVNVEGIRLMRERLSHLSSAA